MSPRNLIVSRGEQELHTLLKAIWNPYHVLAKVAVKDVVDVDNRSLWTTEELNFMFRGAHFDFVVAEGSILWPIIAIEFDGFFHKDPSQYLRDQLKDSICRKDGLRLLRYKRSGLPVFAQNELTIIKGFQELANVVDPVQRQLLQQAYFMMFLIRCLYETSLWDTLKGFDIMIDEAGVVRAGYNQADEKTTQSLPAVGMLRATHDQYIAHLQESMSASGFHIKVTRPPEVDVSSLTDPDFATEVGEPVWPPPHFNRIYVPHALGLSFTFAGERLQDKNFIHFHQQAIGLCLPLPNRPGYVSTYFRIDSCRPPIQHKYADMTTIFGAGPREYCPPLDLEALPNTELALLFANARNSLNSLLTKAKSPL